jgi:hypothetical protein
MVKKSIEKKLGIKNSSRKGRKKLSLKKKVCRSEYF